MVLGKGLALSCIGILECWSICCPLSVSHAALVHEAPESLQPLPIVMACMTFSMDAWTNKFKVVPDHSSSFDSRKLGSDTIHANHMNMGRFNAKDDDGYEKFSGVLTKYIDQIKTEKTEADKARREGQSSSGLWFAFPSDFVSERLILVSVRSSEDF